MWMADSEWVGVRPVCVCAYVCEFAFKPRSLSLARSNAGYKNWETEVTCRLQRHRPAPTSRGLYVQINTCLSMGINTYVHMYVHTLKYTERTWVFFVFPLSFYEYVAGQCVWYACYACILLLTALPITFFPSNQAVIETLDLITNITICIVIVSYHKLLPLHFCSFFFKFFILYSICLLLCFIKNNLFWFFTVGSTVYYMNNVAK